MIFLLFAVIVLLSLEYLAIDVVAILLMVRAKPNAKAMSGEASDSHSNPFGCESSDRNIIQR